MADEQKNTLPTDSSAVSTAPTPAPSTPLPASASPVVQEPAKPKSDAPNPLEVNDAQPRHHRDPHFGLGGAYKIDPATGKRVKA